MPWSKHDSCIYFQPKDYKSPADGICYFAGFDLDSTLIYSDRGDKYSKTATDWIWAYPNIPEMMAQFKKLGWQPCICSNRRGSPKMIADAKKKVDAIMKKFGFEMWVFFATKNDQYRKPETGMITLFAQLGGVKQWGVGSFFCGDAAGPHAKSKWHKWNSADVDFAKASGLTFYEPQERFGEFPVPDIAPTTNLIITVGQRASGWEDFKAAPQEKRPISIVSKPLEMKKGEAVTVVLGENPSRALRDYIRGVYEKVNGVKPTSVIYWYARPAYDEKLMDKAYPTSFQPPGPDEPFFRLN